MPDKPSETEPGEQRAAREHDEARIVPSDLTNKKFVQDFYTNIKSDLILITEDKARHCLRDNIDFMAQSNEWWTAAGILAKLWGTRKPSVDSIIAQMKKLSGKE